MTAAAGKGATPSTPLVNAGIGVGALLLGAFVAITGATPGDDLAALLAAVATDATGLARQADGTAVLLEGKVSAVQDVVDAGLVTLQRQRAVGDRLPGSNDVRYAWETVATEARALRIDTAGGVLQLANTDYAWRDPPRVVPQGAGAVTAGTPRLVGFAVGDAVAVHGVVVRSADGAATVRALEIYGGSREQYLRSHAASHAVPRVLGGAFALLGVGLLVAAWKGWRKAR